MCKSVRVQTESLRMTLRIIFAEKPTFSLEPRSTAGFVGGQASFSCMATAEPDVTQYDWYVAYVTFYIEYLSYFR